MSSSAASLQAMPSIADILFDETVTPEDAEAKLTTFGAKQLRTECYLRQLRIGMKGADCNDHKVGDQAEFGKLNSTLALFAKCNPAIAVPHDAAKLRDMWKDVSSRSNTALANSRVSDTHDNDFFSFCSGKIDVLYMHE
ncbi:hypothetical protein L914_11115 [Phytophthora nicotianae]|uniref:Uncharacterized protein n=4 Tax=Phytophthora nicotianae TaxID=4792 RepID=V9F315_PHYNI|nr:hypothetical protein F443_10197 [Phytophthora nicotianae P1569]ETM43398.1 hypothetical protein L914_11115 [Phytophthora nicotianae]ETO73789.1 hypothetical protein F444_10296 [Phytophthora nicotianae P1976]